MKRTLYVSDLDGTLLDTDSKVSERSKRLLNKVIAAGAMFTVATARTPATVAPLLEGIQINLPAAVMTGAARWNPSTGEYSGMNFHAPACVGRLIDAFRKRLPGFIYTMQNHKLHIYHVGTMSDVERKFMEERSDTPFKEFHSEKDLERELPKILRSTLLLYAMRPSCEVASLYSDIRNDKDSTALFYHDIFGPETGILEIFSAGTSKAAAIKEIARNAGADRIVCFGDNINDLPMMKAADVAVAVGNAVDEVKDAADIVIGLNSQDSVAAFITDDFQKQQGRQ